MTHPNPELHRLLAICPMGTPPLGTLLHRNERTVRRWVNGQYPVDAETAAWIARLCDWIEDHPAPKVLPRARARSISTLDELP